MKIFALLFQQTSAQQPPGGGIGGFLGPLIPMLLVFAVFYFLVLVPQRRRQRDLQQTIAQLKSGDRIVTTGGIVAKITEVRDTTLLVRSADKSILEISRSAVAGLHQEEERK